MNNLKQQIQSLGLYPDNNIPELVERIRESNPIVLEAITKWLNTREITNVIVNGICFNDLQSVCGMNEIASYLTLDWIIKGGENSIKSLVKEYPRMKNYY